MAWHGVCGDQVGGSLRIPTKIKLRCITVQNGERDLLERRTHFPMTCLFLLAMVVDVVQGCARLKATKDV